MSEGVGGNEFMVDLERTLVPSLEALEPLLAKLSTAAARGRQELDRFRGPESRRGPKGDPQRELLVRSLLEMFEARRPGAVAIALDLSRDERRYYGDFYELVSTIARSGLPRVPGTISMLKDLAQAIQDNVEGIRAERERFREMVEEYRTGGIS